MIQAGAWACLPPGLPANVCALSLGFFFWPALQSVLSESFPRWQSGIEAVLRAAVERGELAKGAKTSELAAFVLNSYEGALLRSKAERSRAPLDNFLHIAFGVILEK